jgi:hypothetical protein
MVNRTCFFFCVQLITFFFFFCYLVLHHLTFLYLIYMDSIIIFIAIPSATSMSIVAYLYNTSEIFYSGTRYGQSFIMDSVAWSVSLLLALSMSLASFIGPPGYHYERLE